VLANYIPVIDNAIFLGGLAAIGAGVALAVARTFLAANASAPRSTARPRFAGGILGSAVCHRRGAGRLRWSWMRSRRHLERKAYFELLFWAEDTSCSSPGPCSCSRAGCGSPRPWESPALSPRVTLLIFTSRSHRLRHAGHLPRASGRLVEHHKLQTCSCASAAGSRSADPPRTALGMRRLPARDAAARPIFGALAASIGLFAGAAHRLRDQRAEREDPAHYHGCIVGVTLAFMGLAYHLLPKLGFSAPRSRLAAWQPWLYGGGQLAHIVGLVWSGGYGVERKVAGAAQVLRTPQEVAGMG